ncbi:MAG: PilZ domain-containing protein [Acidobacteria bacterium]|nr:PilZ domain-containing protein [Acidobacteriota bacterium]
MSEAARRRTDRILAPVRIRVIGNDVSGVSFAEETVTVTFNRQGARISLTHSLLPEDIVLIMNMENSIEEEFRVVGGFQQVFGDRREWGVEAVNPESEIWGIVFETPAEGVQPKVLIECAACKKAAQSSLSSIQYEVLLATGMISRHCDRCGETTRWKPSEQPLTAEIIAAAAQTKMSKGDTRKVRRLRLVMRIRVRNAWGVADIAQTRDVSKAGLCFLSTVRFQVGEDVYITLPFAENQAPVETPAKVVWSSESTAGRYYGVCYSQCERRRRAAYTVTIKPLCAA